ncbi:hypothetical protein FA95DRAFT_1675484 [Auriscalpium vulgare]|uniref:Uncharacterized protein n=1 Tax=Auriscalpium vulgare TaxID=40419 RepID=A0ACB8S5T6_9AGAM|nr:hypothetical protein FA95DRAFT_1675484 [Auriscalpium vulgare]
MDLLPLSSTEVTVDSNELLKAAPIDPSRCPPHPDTIMAVEVPLDVQIIVIEWVFRSSQHASIDYTTLRACALVCRAWTPTAQRLLFRRIFCLTLKEKGHCRMQLLFDVLSTRLHLAAHVRSIQVYCPPEADDVCVRLLELCPQVEGISSPYYISDINAFRAGFDARPHAIQPKLVLLDVAGTDNSITGVVQMFPSARVLILRAAGYSDYLLPPTLEALEIHAGSARRCLPLSMPLPALRYLCLVRPKWSDNALCEHLISTSILPQIQSLQIRGQFPPQGILEQLIQLKTLVVETLPEQNVKLPRLLRHVGYHTVEASPDVRAELAVNPLRMLLELQLVTVTRSVEQHVRAALEGMCHDKDIDFASYETPYFFQEPRNIDWI